MYQIISLENCSKAHLNSEAIFISMFPVFSWFFKGGYVNMHVCVQEYNIYPCIYLCVYIYTYVHTHTNLLLELEQRTSSELEKI